MYYYTEMRSLALVAYLGYQSRSQTLSCYSIILRDTACTRSMYAEQHLEELDECRVAEHGIFIDVVFLWLGMGNTS